MDAYAVCVDLGERRRRCDAIAWLNDGHHAHCHLDGGHPGDHECTSDDGYTKWFNNISYREDSSPERIMSGDYSRDMWEAINSARTKRDLREALYLVCCRLQELEARMMEFKKEGNE